MRDRGNTIYEDPLLDQLREEMKQDIGLTNAPIGKVQAEQIIEKSIINMTGVVHNRGLQVEGIGRILEEAIELKDANAVHEIIEELSDILEAINYLKIAMQISQDIIDRKIMDKKEQNGGFDNGVLLKKVVLTDDHPSIYYYLHNPNKYPEMLQ